jgi:two-component system KDP operon response regulator KdpE
MNPSRVSVLVVEDDDAIRRFLRVTLEGEHFKVIEAGSALAAYGAALRHHPDLYLVDLGLPDMDGVALIARLRETTSNPVIVLTARTEESAKVEALDAGADDYLTKPFGVHELKARVRVALRHLNTSRAPGARPVFWLGEVRVDLEARQVTRGTSAIHLTPTEYRLLDHLARQPGRVVTQRALLLEIWGAAYERDTHYLRIYIRQLRKKLEPEAALPRHFLTEPGVGYRLVLSPDPDASSDAARASAGSAPIEVGRQHDRGVGLAHAIEQSDCVEGAIEVLG